MNIITGKTGTPHVTSQQAREINMGIVGNGNYVLNVGNALRSETVSNNTIRIYDGVLMLQGCAASIDANTYEDMTINNGTQGAGRIDLICARYQKHTDNGTESVELVVVEGTPAVNPTVPAVNTGEIRENDVTVDFPLYRVRLDGINTPVVEQLFTVANCPITKAQKDILETYNLLMDFKKAHNHELVWQGYSNNTVIELPSDYIYSTHGLAIIYQVGSNKQIAFIPKYCALFNPFKYSIERVANNVGELRRVCLNLEITNSSIQVTHSCSTMGNFYYPGDVGKPLTIPESIWAQENHLYVTHVCLI